MGLKGDNFVMLAADTMMVRRIFILNDSEYQLGHNLMANQHTHTLISFSFLLERSKILRLDKHTIMGVVGNEGDCVRFSEYIKISMRLYEIKNGVPMGFSTLTHFTRNHLVSNLRTNPTCQVAMLLAGWDPQDGPQLYFIDMQGSAQSLKYSGHGLGTAICASILHDFWKPNMNREQAYDIVKACVTEIQKRLVINLRNFEVIVVDAQGVENLESLNHSSMNKPVEELTVT